MTTAKRIRELRIEEGLTVAELADRMQITEEYIRQVEAGSIHPGVLMLGYLAAALDVDREELEGSG